MAVYVFAQLHSAADGVPQSGSTSSNAAPGCHASVGPCDAADSRGAAKVLGFRVHVLAAALRDRATTYTKRPRNGTSLDWPSRRSEISLPVAMELAVPARDGIASWLSLEILRI
jgi:hypothetical protein